MKLLHCDYCNEVMKPENATVHPAMCNAGVYVIRANFYEQGKASDICQACKRKLLAYAIDNRMVAL